MNKIIRCMVLLSFLGISTLHATDEVEDFLNSTIKNARDLSKDLESFKRKLNSLLSVHLQETKLQGNDALPTPASLQKDLFKINEIFQKIIPEKILNDTLGPILGADWHSEDFSPFGGKRDFQLKNIAGNWPEILKEEFEQKETGSIYEIFTYKRINALDNEILESFHGLNLLISFTEGVKNCSRYLREKDEKRSIGLILTQMKKLSKQSQSLLFSAQQRALLQKEFQVYKKFLGTPTWDFKEEEADLFKGKLSELESLDVLTIANAQITSLFLEETYKAIFGRTFHEESEENDF